MAARARRRRQSSGRRPGPPRGSPGGPGGEGTPRRTASRRERTLPVRGVSLLAIWADPVRVTCAVIRVRRRRGWVLHLIAAAAALLVALLAYPAVGAAAPASIQQENALPGSPGWRYSDAPWGTTAQQYAGVVASIYGYTAEQSVAPGGQVQLHVGTAAGLRYRVEIYRLGWYGGRGRAAPRLPAELRRRPGRRRAAPAPGAEPDHRHRPGRLERHRHRSTSAPTG